MNDVLNIELFSYGSFRITVFSLLAVVITVVVTRIIVYALERSFKQFFERRHVDTGRRSAVVQIIKYMIYTFALLIILKSVGIGLTGLMVGGGALLVGIGFGLQQTFNDFISGIILLFEGGVQVGDNLIVQGLACTVQKIGLRSTEVLTRDDVKIIIPNSTLVSNNVTNMGHEARPARFYIDAGIPYDADIQLVERLMLEAAADQHAVRSMPHPRVHLEAYGESALIFRLYFYSREYVRIERVRSELRKRLFLKLRAHDIFIPYPQRDLHVYRHSEASPPDLQGDDAVVDDTIDGV